MQAVNINFEHTPHFSTVYTADFEQIRYSSIWSDRLGNFTLPISLEHFAILSLSHFLHGNDILHDSQNNFQISRFWRQKISCFYAVSSRKVLETTNVFLRDVMR